MNRAIAALILTGFVFTHAALVRAEEQVSYNDDIAPLFRKYCAGCHNDDELQGEFSLESYQSLMKGTEKGPAFLAERPEDSRIYRLMSGMVEPKMPPEDEPAPSKEEIELVRVWIEQGATAPKGMEPDRLSVKVPTIDSQTDRRPITAVAISPNGDARATARFSEVLLERELRTKDSESGKRKADWYRAAHLKDFPGKVNSVHFCLGGGKVITSSGVAGLGGVATLWEWPLSKKIREFKGHRDIMFDAEVSPDGKLLATCSYDPLIILWDLQTGEKLRELTGHNGAVYDVCFSPDSKILLSASADSTCKVWRVSDGLRLDTLGQPLKEQYSVSFSPDGNLMVGAGADNRIRVWKLTSKNRPRINPLLYARFAHEGAIVNLSFSDDGKHLVSLAEDRTIKVWETKSFTETRLIENQSEVAMALALAPNNRSFLVGRLDGTMEEFTLPKPSAKTQREEHQVAITPKAISAGEMNSFTEQEPNQATATANAIELPTTVNGVINSDEAGADIDCFRFSANAGEEWVFEINAARSKSPLDSFVDVVTTDGQQIERVLLQAVRDSYFTFRGKTADQSNDFRLFNWEEMELNEYLYANGEVVKLWLYPRGPDSGFNVYPGTGNRWGYFDTTPLAHALGEPTYIVKPHPPGTELIPNGLPVFPLYYQNDDEAQRKLGKDSKLIFTSPAKGDYVLRVRDVRSMEGTDFNYTLTARPRKEDFRVNLVNKSLTIPEGGAREFRLTAERLDQFDGPVTVEISGLPDGYTTSSPITIQAGQIEAIGVITASPGSKPLDAEAAKSVKFIAKSSIHGKTIQHDVAGFTELKIDDKPKLEIAISPAPGGAVPLNSSSERPLEFEIQPGQTIMLQVNATRHDFKGEVSFGKEFAGRNLPHGLFVDNIGLNGLLLLSDQTEREFFITAADWVPMQSRLFHLETGASGGHATLPVLLHIRSPTTGNSTGAE